MRRMSLSSTCWSMGLPAFVTMSSRTTSGLTRFRFSTRISSTGVVSAGGNEVRRFSQAA